MTIQHGKYFTSRQKTTIIIIIIRFIKALASEALAAGQSWVLIKSLMKEVRLKPRFKDRR